MNLEEVEKFLLSYLQTRLVMARDLEIVRGPLPAKSGDVISIIAEGIIHSDSHTMPHCSAQIYGIFQNREQTAGRFVYWKNPVNPAQHVRRDAPGSTRLTGRRSTGLK